MYRASRIDGVMQTQEATTGGLCVGAIAKVD